MFVVEFARGAAAGEIVEHFRKVHALLHRDLRGGGQRIAGAGGAVADGEHRSVGRHAEFLVGLQPLRAVFGKRQLLHERGCADAGGPDHQAELHHAVVGQGDAARLHLRHHRAGAHIDFFALESFHRVRAEAGIKRVQQRR